MHDQSHDDPVPSTTTTAKTIVGGHSGDRQDPPKPDAGVSRPTIVLLGRRLRAYTGVVTIAERDTKQHTEIQSIYGEGGRVVATHNVDMFTHNVRFRIVVAGGDGHPFQVPVQVGIDRTFLFLQDGDLVTLIGCPTKEGLFKDPAILNHAGRFTILPQRWSRRRTLVLPPIAIAALLYFFATSEITRHVLLGEYYLLYALHWAAGLLAVAAGFASIRNWWWRHGLAKAARRIRKGFGPDWEKHRYVDPSGAVEGVFAFTRGQRNPVEWVSFRLAIAGKDGRAEDRIVAVAPQSRLVTDLRRGDQLQLRGRLSTGAIVTPRRITLAVG